MHRYSLNINYIFSKHLFP